MKFVLVLVVFPTFFSNGREQHIEFETMSECLTISESLHIQRDHLKYCTVKGQDEWFYENQRKQD